MVLKRIDNRGLIRLTGSSGHGQVLMSDKLVKRSKCVARTDIS